MRNGINSCAIKRRVVMKIRLYVLSILALLVLAVPAFAQQVELDTPQTIAIFGTGFYPFSDAANQSFKKLVNENGLVAIVIKNFNGKPLKIAPAADYKEIGRKKNISADGIVILDYKKKKGKRFGLSFKGKPTSLNIEVQPFAGRPCKSPVNCQDDCGVNLGKCCEADASGNQKKICVSVGTSSCGCANR